MRAKDAHVECPACGDDLTVGIELAPIDNGPVAGTSARVVTLAIRPDLSMIEDHIRDHMNRVSGDAA